MVSFGKLAVLTPGAYPFAERYALAELLTRQLGFRRDHVT